MPKFHLPHDARIIKVPCSEVAMHIRMADKIVYAALSGPNAVQLYDPEERGKQYSAPILRSEAGWDQQLVQDALTPNDPRDKEQRKRLPRRFTAFVYYGEHPGTDGEHFAEIEEIDVDVATGVREKEIREFVEGMLRLDYNPGWDKIELEERFGMYV